MVTLIGDRRIDRCLRLLAAAVVIAAFWWFVAPRVRMPSWYFAVLPAAFLGCLVAFRESRWSTWICLAILLGTIESTFLSQWFPEHARLNAAEKIRQSVEQQAQIHAAIAAHIAQTQNTQAVENHAGSSESTSTSPAHTGPIHSLQLSFHLTLANFPHAWHDWLLAVLLGTLAAAQAARMMISSSIIR